MSEESHISEVDLERALKDAGMTEEEFSNQVPVQSVESQISKKNEQKYKDLDELTKEKKPILDQDEIDRLFAGLSKED